MRGKRIVFFLIMIVLGLVGGLIYGWMINPIRNKGTQPAMLRADFKADYVLMAAEIYHADQNLEQAARRVAVLGSQPPAQIAAEAVVNAHQLGYGTADLELMEELSMALQSPAAGPTIHETATGGTQP